MKRYLVIGSTTVLVMIALAVGLVFYVWSSLDSIIKEAVETYGSEVTQAEVTLDDVDLDLGNGRLGLRGLRVGNPAGFETPSAFRLGAVRVKIDTATVNEDPFVISEIVIDKPEVTYEISAAGNNIDTLQKNIERYIEAKGLGGGGSAGGGEAGKEDEDQGGRMIIKDLYVRGGVVNVSATILKGRALSAPLPEIHLTDLGKDEGGATPGEIAEKVLSALTAAASKAAGGLGVGKTLDSLKGRLGELAGGAGNLGEAVGQAVGQSVKEGASGLGKSVGEGAADLGKSVTEGAAGALKGLLGGGD